MLYSLDFKSTDSAYKEKIYLLSCRNYEFQNVGLVTLKNVPIVENEFQSFLFSTIFTLFNKPFQSCSYLCFDTNLGAKPFILK